MSDTYTTHDFAILTDSSADLTSELVNELEVSVLPLAVLLEGKSYQDFPDHRELDPHGFYDKLREGAVATTNAVNVFQASAAMLPLLKEGKDVLVLAFSSGLSATCNAIRMAAEELAEQFPNRKIYVVDTLCASMGQGLLVWYAARMRKEGKSLDEVRDWVEANKLRLCHWFTVNDLMHLKRGGRVSAATALVGTMLSIKPVLHVDDEGHLVNMSKARGRKASLLALVDRMEQTAIDPAGQTVFISHGDCLEDAQMVADEIKRRMGVREVVINYVGPVIGAHTGPGVVALFFMGKVR